MEDFECEMCGEECDGTLKFREHIIFDNGQVEDNYPVCPECIATLFTECADEIIIFECKLEAI